MKALRLLAVLLGCVVSSGCDSGPSAQQKAELRDRARPVLAFEKQLGTMAGAISKEFVPCPEGLLRSTIARTQNRRALFVDARVLKVAAQGKPVQEASPLSRLTSPAFAKRTGTSAVVDEKTATEALFAVVSLKKQYDFLATLEFTFKAPEADDKGFHAGELRGILALFELASTKPLCSAPLSADSSLEAVRKPGQTQQQAADKDFEMQIRRALEETFSQMTRELVLELN